ncbi:MAG: tripartite tricarboxylate transporter TctB family protein [Sphaerochaeta sp.]|nr:tripartite tricarboxylate transporter TctB family protein [Sphaerochaeta sp.]
MKFNDALIGGVLLILSVAILGYVNTFPAMPLSTYGPATFPKLLGTGLLASSVYLIISGIRNRKTVPWTQFAAWTQDRRRWLRFMEIPLAILGYVIIAPFFGYILYVFVALVLILLDFTEMRWKVSIITAAVFSVVSFLIFSNGLMVPLPQGFLGSII